MTLLFKILLSFFLNRYNFAGFYRKRPLIQNISSLCFECWHLGLTLSYIILRCVKLFGIMIVYVGRFDTPVLAKGVGEIGPIKLDAFPFIFKQDLLAMDAHRHPYIERLGMMVRQILKFLATSFPLQSNVLIFKYSLTAFAYYYSSITCST